MFILASCKDENWGDTTLDFAHNEAPNLILNLSRKDLESKWFNYNIFNLNFGMEEINKAQLMLKVLHWSI
jgi:hypothetical protein